MGPQDGSVACRCHVMPSAESKNVVVSAFVDPAGRFVYYLQDTDGNELGHWVRVPFAGGPPEDFEELTESARAAIAALPGVEEVQVETVPMTDEERLRMFGRAFSPMTIPR